MFKLKQTLMWICAVWAIAALALFGMAIGGVISKDTFQWLFVAGFILFAVIASLLSHVLYQGSTDSDEKGDSQNK